MKIIDIYKLIIEQGKKVDPRGDEINNVLDDAEKEYKKLEEKEQQYFDKDKLFNPYDDTRILYGEKDKEISTILAGIDIETSEILLADRLKEKGMNIDLILAHHPEGKALAGLYGVMKLQEDILYNLGIPINIAQGLLASRISEVQRGLMPLNHNRTIDAAKLLDIPLMCCHTPADNQVQEFLNNFFANRNVRLVGDVIDALMEIPEYQEAMKVGAGPKIIVGDKKRKTGKIFVDMTGGTSGSQDAYDKLAIAGVGTIIGMHMGENHRKKAEKNHINVIIAGHMASDSLGMNLILDKLEDSGIKVITCSGLTRVRR